MTIQKRRLMKWAKKGARSLVGKYIEIKGKSIFPTTEKIYIAGQVLDADDDFIIIRDSSGKEQEYVWRRGFYGAHGDIDGIADLLDEEHATIRFLRPLS